MSEDKELFAQIANESTPESRMLAASALAGTAPATLQLGVAGDDYHSARRSGERPEEPGA